MVLVATVAMAYVPPVAAQEGLKPATTTCERGVALTGLSDPLRRLARLTRLAGLDTAPDRLYRRPSDRDHLRLCDTPWSGVVGVVDSASARIAPASLHQVVNSTYPRDRNNGALWAGRGYGGALDFGLIFRWGPLSAAVLPSVAFQQNEDFTTLSTDIPGWSELAYPWAFAAIDYPQRFGYDSFVTLDLGQSYLRLDWEGLAVGFSTENLWWGPALRNPLLMSNTAPGFPHAFVGTSEPVDIGIGHADVRITVGRLTESHYFNTNSFDDHRYFSGITASYAPEFLPGLSVGVSRTYTMQVRRDTSSWGSFLGKAFSNPRENPVRGIDLNDQLASIFGRWVFPDAGFEIYGEWGREDQWGNLLEFLRIPQMSRAYMVGLQKLFEGDGRWTALYAEHITVADPVPILTANRGVLMWYTHSQIKQGHTHRGQLLGSWIGPGSNSQVVGFDRYERWGSVGGYLERVVFNDDAYFARWADTFSMYGHDLELTVAVRGLLFLGDFDVSGELSLSRRWGRNFIGYKAFMGAPASEWDFIKELNLGVELALRWRPRERRSQ